MYRTEAAKHYYCYSSGDKKDLRWTKDPDAYTMMLANRGVESERRACSEVSVLMNQNLLSENKHK